MLTVIILSIFTFVCLVISFIFDRKKTIQALKKAFKMLLNLLPPFFTIIIIISILLFLIPKEALIKWFGKETGMLGMILAAIVGSISLIPGFIAYPLGSILVKNGVSYSVIAIFITTLMMVGIVTLPVEIKIFGVKASILRNILSFIGALIVGILIGLLWSII